MQQVRVNYNGYQVEFINENDVDRFIKSKLRKDLKPKKIFESYSHNKWVVVYEYYTLYQEVFVIIK